MNNDPFTAAARAEAERDHPDDDYEGSGGAERCAFMAGAVWARDHPAAQEPTDAEAVAYLAAFVEDLSPGEGDEWTPDTIARVKRGLRAARAARRDEEKRDG